MRESQIQINAVRAKERNRETEADRNRDMQKPETVRGVERKRQKEVERKYRDGQKVQRDREKEG